MARLQFSAVALLPALLSILSIAQGGTTSEVKFYVPGGRVPTTTRAELISGEGTPVGETMVDVSGTVRFGMLRDGNYSVYVSGPGIEAAIYEVRLMPAESTHVEMFQLRPLREASTAGPNSYPGVSALDLDAPPKARKEIEKANQALKEHDWAEARERCEKAIEIYPKFVSAYNELGVVLIRLDERDKARRALQEAINLDPNFARPFINLARMNAADRNFVEAEKLLIKAASDDPKKPKPCFCWPTQSSRMHTMMKLSPRRAN